MLKSSPDDITGLLMAWGGGDKAALDRLMPLVYQGLRRVARRQMRRERQGDTLQTTALVNEAYLRLIDYERVQPRDRNHFLAAAAVAMRRILVDRARRKRRLRHGGARQRIPLDQAAAPAPPTAADELLALDDALTRLAAADPDAAAVVQLRYFGGLSVEEAADALGQSRATAYRHWTFARAWLHQQMTGGRPG